MERFTVAGAQLVAAPNAPETNRERVLTWMERARTEHDADLVVFPETITTGFDPGPAASSLYEMAEPLPGPFSDRVGEAAARLGLHVVLPVYERGHDSNTIYNSAALIDDEGRLLGVYRKTHLFPTERLHGGGWTTAGSEAPVFSTRLGRIGIMICYDGDFPELARLLAIGGAEVIVRPSALLRSYEIWDLTNRARAYDSHVYVVGVNAVGQDAGGHCYFGHSQIISPIAHRLAQGRGTEEIVSATLDPDPLRFVSYGTKSPQLFDHLEDRNLSVYRGLCAPAKSAFEPSRRIPYVEPPATAKPDRHES